jgi:GPI-anchor transamidase subunit GAA1
VKGEISKERRWQVATQNFNFSATPTGPIQGLKEKIQGHNVYAVFRAPRGDGSESILLSAPLTISQNDDDDDDEKIRMKLNSFGIATCLGIIQSLTKTPFYAKDVVIVFPDQGPVGMQAWIQSFLGLISHHYSAVESEPLQFYAGAIQAALNLELGNDTRSSKLGIVTGIYISLITTTTP